MLKSTTIIMLAVLSANGFATCETSGPQLYLNNDIYCTGDLKNQVVLFKFSSGSNLGYSMSSEWFDCGEGPSYEWQEVNERGEVLRSQNAKPTIYMVKGKSYQMKVSINANGCSNFSSGFQLERIAK